MYFFALTLETLVHCTVPVLTADGLTADNLLGDILMLRSSGLRGSLTNEYVGRTWCIPAMLLGMLLMYPFLRRFTDTF